MALSFRQDWQLRGIERGLRESEPEMAAMLEDFAGLNAGKVASGTPEGWSAGGWTRRQLSRIARGCLVGAAGYVGAAGAWPPAGT